MASRNIQGSRPQSAGLYRLKSTAFDVLGDPVRRRILGLLVDGEHSSGDVVAVIESEFGITQSAVSQHLRVLRDNGFATVRVSGARRLYSVVAAPLHEVDSWLNTFRVLWEPRLDALATEVARGRHKRRDEQRSSARPSPANATRPAKRMAG